MHNSSLEEKLELSDACYCMCTMLRRGVAQSASCGRKTTSSRKATHSSADEAGAAGRGANGP